MNPFVAITAVALLVQSIMLVLFFSLPDPLGLSLSEMFAGKTIWQVFMAFGAILVMSGIFAFLKKPRALAVFYSIYFFFAIADYEVFRFSHQRLSYSFIRTYFHFSNITDATTISTLGGDALGTFLWVALLFLIIFGGVFFCVAWTIKKRKKGRESIAAPTCSKKVPIWFVSVGMGLSITPLILFIGGVRGTTEFPFNIDWRFTLGKYTLTAPVLHIAALETFEFVRDDFTITDELIEDLDSFLPADFAANRIDKEYPAFRGAPSYEYKAQKPYNIVFIFGESFKSRYFNQMLAGDTAFAPHVWKLASGGYFPKAVDSTGVEVPVGGGLWFKHGFSGSYPTVRGTTSTYLGFPSHPNRDVPCFYASNHFTGFQEYLTHYKKAYMTISNPVFDHTLPFIEKFYGDNWRLAEEKVEGDVDSIGVDLAIEMLKDMPTDSPWFLSANTIATHIPFRHYPDGFAPKPEDALERYKHAIHYTDNQLGRLFTALSERPDFDRTVIILLGDHDTPVDSLDYKVPQPLGVASAEIFMGIFSADSALFQGLQVREDVASQLDVGPTIFDLAGVRASHHFWGYDLLTQERPADQPAVFYSQNAYYLGFRDHVLTGGLENEEVYKGVDGNFEVVTDDVARSWKAKAVGASKVVRSLLRNDNMRPE
ncbi:MAG: sulfatase-like hydrolase/transferase [Fibrobacter sp.]|nr:sulfatase-like hydrolase/transferase [Fibrobacter sp.]